MIRSFGLLLFSLSIHFASAQVKLSNEVTDIKMVYNQDSSMIHGLHWNRGNKAVQYTLPKPLSLFSLSEKNNKYGKSYLQNRIIKTITTKQGIQIQFEILNTSLDTLELHNIIPFEIQSNQVYITGLGNHTLSRTHLFIPNKKPVNVIVPDNAWEMGYNTMPLFTPQNELDSLYLYGFSRRDRASVKNGKVRRFESILYPKGTVRYTIWIEIYKGNWQNGITTLFQQRKLYDLEHFNDTLYQRKDLEWVRHSYLMHLMMSWDQFFYNNKKASYSIPDFIQRGEKLYGGDDIIAIWPTWPTLGLDQRNQFDLFNDLPGGLSAIKNISNQLTALNKHLFVSYNPWDVDTRKMDHYKGLSKLIESTNADGVVLDTQGSSSEALQNAADSVRKGVIMYSEGMAVPSAMTGIISGRVHNALYYPPMLNLNKWIQPGFAIYRVAELYKEPIRREFATSFFNGYGTEINIMAPGQPEWVESQYAFLGKTTRLLRQLSDNFNAPNAIPLYPSLEDDIWVNAWPTENKTVYTIYSLKPEGFKGPLFSVTPKAGWHFVDVFHHELISPMKMASTSDMILAETESFHKKYLGTNNESAVDCIIHTPIQIQASVIRNDLNIQWVSTLEKKEDCFIQIWTTEPSYTNKPLLLKAISQTISIQKYFGQFEGKLVIQLMQKNRTRETLLDETIIKLESGASRIMDVLSNPKKAVLSTNKMVPIPSGKFTFHQTHGDDFIPYPIFSDTSKIEVASFWMDQFPVTNLDFYHFIQSSHYKPTDTHNYLKHWLNGKPTAKDENKPVTFVSYEDATAFANYYGKALPTEIQWQYAGQGTSLKEWPWVQKSPVTRTYEEVTNTLSVINIKGIDSNYCNLGNGVLDNVGAYPKGKSAFGVSDLVGSVWQLTQDIYASGSYQYIIMKGGSYFKPAGSWWYVQGGPRELTYAQYLLRVSPGFERNGTVGFRCVYNGKR
ncbi:MAG: SUMF1/EgtB/PvdO family nonheme iron enzyme [Bacteroidetes bacterium]|nr:SUMF1/EgtB/PvdO family nonheme iron enzyme [Bacteroidota bacterium]